MSVLSAEIIFDDYVRVIENLESTDDVNYISIE